MDVHNAFLHGDLLKEVYMRFSHGFIASHPNKVCRIRKALYGLKQAPRCWFEKLTKALKNLWVRTIIGRLFIVYCGERFGLN